MTNRILTCGWFMSCWALSMVGSGVAVTRFGGPPASHHGLVEPADGLNGDPFGVGVGVEDHRVAGRNCRDGVVDDGRGRVRRGGDGADDAEGRELGDRQPLVAGPHLRFQVFGAGSFFDHQEVFQDLVLGAPETGFAVGHLGQLAARSRIAWRAPSMMRWRFFKPIDR